MEEGNGFGESHGLSWDSGEKRGEEMRVLRGFGLIE